MKTTRLNLAPILSSLMFLAGLTTAGAATVLQSQNVTNLGDGGAGYIWNAFDTDLGTLTSAVFVVNGTYSGSFSVQAQGGAVTVSDPAGVTTMYFDTPALEFSPSTSLTTSPGSGTSVARNATQTFTIQGSPGVTINSGNLVSATGFTNYFTTSSSFTTYLQRYVSLNTSGGTPNSSDTNTKVNGTISLTYTYTPVEPVPEISTVTMGGAGGLLLLGIAARSRRRQQPSDNVPA
jgi:hypothetical protein